MDFGDYPFARMLMPSLITIKPPAFQIDVSVTQDEIQRLNLLDCHLIEREST